MSDQWDVVIGATSGIGMSLARDLARAGRRLVITGSDGDELDRCARDLALRGSPEVRAVVADARDPATHEAWVRTFDDPARVVDRVVLLTGLLGDMDAAKVDASRAREIFDVNVTGALALLHPVARALAKAGRGRIAIVGSVAGDRGRASNYPYGAAKAAVAAWAEGLRGELFRHGVHVCLVKPGFVDTAMTYGRPGMFLVATPESIARGILRALDRRADVAYLPWFWGPILWAIRMIPTRVFKRLRL